MKDFIKTHRKEILIGLVGLGVILIAVSAILIGIIINKKYSVTGAWYNEGLQQQLRFVDEDSMVISTVAGVNEAKYYFDNKSGEGEIVINGVTVNFYRKGNSIFLVGSNGEAEYSKGELPVNVLATVTTAAPPETTVEITPEATETTASSASVTETTSEALATSTPTPSPNPTPTGIPIFPKITIDFDPFLPILGTPVVGTWLREDNNGTLLVFDADGNVEMINAGVLYAESTYTYDSFSGEGFILTPYDGDVAFTVTGDILVWEYDYGIYQLQD